MTKTIANQVSYVLIGCAILLMAGVLLSEILRSNTADKLNGRVAAVAAATTITTSTRPIATATPRPTGEAAALAATLPPTDVSQPTAQDLVAPTTEPQPADTLEPPPIEEEVVEQQQEEAPAEPPVEAAVELQPTEAPVQPSPTATELPVEVSAETPIPSTPGLPAIAIQDAALFERANASSARLGYYVPKEQSADIIGRSEDNSWLHVRHLLGIEGWVFASLLDVTYEDLVALPISLLGDVDGLVLLAPTLTPIPTGTPELPYIRALADAALFTGPGGDSGHIGYYVPAERTAWILGISEDQHWYHVLHLIGVEGWVSSRYFDELDEELLAVLPTSNFAQNTATIDVIATPLPLAGIVPSAADVVAKVESDPAPAQQSTPSASASAPTAGQPEPTKPVWPTSTPWTGFVSRATATPLVWPTRTPFPTARPRATATPRVWPTQTPVATARATVIAQINPTNTPRPAAVATKWPTRTPYPTATNRPAAVATKWPTRTPYPTVTNRPAATRTPWPTTTPWPTATARPQTSSANPTATRSVYNAPTLAPTLAPGVTPTATPTLQPGENPIVSSAIAYWIEDTAESQRNNDGTWRAGLIVRVPTSFRYNFEMENLKRIRLSQRNLDGDDIYTLTFSGMTCGQSLSARLTVEQDGARMQVRNDFSYEDGPVLLKSPC